MSKVSKSSTNTEMSPIELNKFLSQKAILLNAYDNLVVNLRRRKLSGSHSCAKATIEILRSCLGQLKFHSTEHMLQTVKAIGHGLMNAAPSELTIGNIIRRILKLIKEEHHNAMVEEGKKNTQKDTNAEAENVTVFNDKIASSTSNIIRSMSGNGLFDYENTAAVQLTNSTTNPTASIDILNKKVQKQYQYESYIPDMRPNLLSSINEYIDEIDSVVGPICDQAPEHIHAGETILTIGSGASSPNCTLSTELFMKAAAKKRKFNVIVAENAPSLDGHTLAASLTKSCPNISVTLIPDSAIYALMCRVNKVILSPLAVMADGGAICHCGHMGVAAAAKEFSIPVLCIATTYMLTPIFAHTQDQLLNQLKPPSDILAYNADYDIDSLLQVVVPSFDYLPPSNIAIYVTNNGSYQPSYIYRLLAECYDPLDYNF